MNRKNASGTSVIAQKKQPSSTIATPRNVPRGGTPAWASTSASTEPSSIPAYTSTFANAMIAPRRSSGDRHCSRALSGTNRNPLKIPSRVMMIMVPARPGPMIAKASVVTVRPRRTQREQAVLDLRPGKFARQHATHADADPQCGQRQARLPFGQEQHLRRIRQDRRGYQAGDRPGQDLADERELQDAVGPDRFPGDPERHDHPTLGPGRLDPRDRQRGEQAAGGEGRQQDAAVPEGYLERLRGRDDHAARDDPAEDGQVRAHFQQAVPGREPFVGQDLGEDPVLGRAEQREPGRPAGRVSPSPGARLAARRRGPPSRRASGPARRPSWPR